MNIPADTVLLLDGGLSTALEHRGHRVDGSLWTGEMLLTDPGAVAEAHRDFVEAGADIIITGSYQLSFAGCSRAGWSDDDTIRALRNSTTAARVASVEGTLVAASIGPFGAALGDGSEFRGGYGVDTGALRDFHARRLDILLETEPDLLAIETQPEFAEIDVILTLLHERDPDMPFWVTCTSTDAGRIAGGAPWADVVARVEADPAALAVGINCSSVDHITETLREASPTIPYIAYPNLGNEWVATTNAWTGATRPLREDDLRAWIAAGVRVIGGCCGFGADDVRRIGSLL